MNHEYRKKKAGIANIERQMIPLPPPRQNAHGIYVKQNFFLFSLLKFLDHVYIE